MDSVANYIFRQATENVLFTNFQNKFVSSPKTLFRVKADADNVDGALFEFGKTLFRLSEYGQLNPYFQSW